MSDRKIQPASPRLCRICGEPASWLTARPDSAARQWVCDEHRVEQRCPDGGACHNVCLTVAECFRVSHASPLSGVYPDDKWPADVTR